jgi:catechol 2,3-dioxygenase-like lactoylglutathione lyase family enzyme
MAGVIVSLDHVQVGAPAGCEEPARLFYGDLLELTELPKPRALAARGGVWFALGDGRQLHVGVDPGFAAARKAHPALALRSAPALEQLAARLERHGHEPSWDDELPGVRRFYVSDPFGNRLELLVREPVEA